MCWVLKNYGLKEFEKCAQKVPEPSGRFFTWLTVLIVPLLNWKLLLRLNGNRRQLKCVLLGRGIRMVLLWMFHTMHVLLSSCNIFSGIGQNLISCDHGFILQNISFDKCRITSRVSVPNCLYFHSSCLYWPVIVATNGMAEAPLEWSSLFHLTAQCAFHSYIPTLSSCLTILFWFCCFTQQ